MTTPALDFAARPKAVATATRFGYGHLSNPAFAAEISSIDPVLHQRIAVYTIRGYAAKGESFAFETTLSGLGYTRWIPLWREGGYRVKLLFLWLPTPDLAVARVRQRVSEGGHDVPETIVRRRFRAGWRNFERVYRDLVDEWAIYDNSGISPVLLAEGGNR